MRNGSNDFINFGIICFSHLRWDFVFQRPQHLLTRAAKTHKVFFVEEPVFNEHTKNPFLDTSSEKNITIIKPTFPSSYDQSNINAQVEVLLRDKLGSNNLPNYIFWYYTPMALPFTKNFAPSLIVYDCMDELSQFAGAHPEMVDNENKLLSKAHIVFTGGNSLYESKRKRHPNVFCFHSSIDKNHFDRRYNFFLTPEDQVYIPFPRIGYFGVIDERLDIKLIDSITGLKPDWSWIFIGPVVKIDPSSLPKKNNIFYLGKKDYKSLPEYINTWDVASMPFAKNKSTEFISPTKVLEYLAAGKPVVSTSITDVVYPYGEQNVVSIADTPEAFVEEIESLLNMGNREEWNQKVQSILAGTSWNNTWTQMENIIIESLIEQNQLQGANAIQYQNNLNPIISR